MSVLILLCIVIIYPMLLKKQCFETFFSRNKSVDIIYVNLYEKQLNAITE